jgi:hypothetical protein
MLLSVALAAGCGTEGTGDPRGTGGQGGSGGSETGGTGGDVGTGGAGGMVVPACSTNSLCRSCPSDGSCDTNGDCSVGFVCIESGCSTLEGDAIKQCVFGGGGACETTASCPSGRQCLEVPGEGKRCVKTTTGCDTSFDCVLGFSCEDGECVDRRLPCSIDDHCPKNHTCVSTANSSFCLRIHRDCQAEFDCVDLAPRCEDVDGDGTTECAGVFNPNQSGSDACLNDDCSDVGAPVCEAAGVGSTTVCGQYGLCRDGDDCAVGFSCVGLWPDGRKECVPNGGDCTAIADCPVRQVCASPRQGGAPSCQPGFVE